MALPERVEEVRVRAYLDGPNLVPGLLSELVVESTVPEGQHLYGRPVPDGMIATSIEFDHDDEMIVRESQGPDTSPHQIRTGEVLHIYEGVVAIRTLITVVGSHGLAQDGEQAPLGIGDRVISGVGRFQTCDDEACGLPQTARFEVPLRVEPSIVGDYGGPAFRNEPMHGEGIGIVSSRGMTDSSSPRRASVQSRARNEPLNWSQWLRKELDVRHVASFIEKALTAPIKSDHNFD